MRLLVMLCMADERSASTPSFRKRSFDGFAVLPNGRAFGVILAASLLGCEQGRDVADPVTLRTRLGITTHPSSSWPAKRSCGWAMPLETLNRCGCSQ